MTTQELISTVGGNIRHYRKKKKMKQYETGRVMPSATSIVLCADLLGVEIWQLFKIG